MSTVTLRPTSALHSHPAGAKVTVRRWTGWSAGGVPIDLYVLRFVIQRGETRGDVSFVVERGIARVTATVAPIPELGFRTWTGTIDSGLAVGLTIELDVASYRVAEGFEPAWKDEFDDVREGRPLNYDPGPPLNPWHGIDPRLPRLVQ